MNVKTNKQWVARRKHLEFLLHFKHQTSSKISNLEFLSDPGVPGVRSMGPDVRQSVRPRGFADLTDVTLADEDNNSIPTDDVN